MEIYNEKPLPPVKARQGRAPRLTADAMMMLGKAVTEEGMTFREAAKMFGCSHGVITNAKKIYLSGVVPDSYFPDEVTPARQITKLKEQVDNLKREIGELYIENRLLKKAQSLVRRKRKRSSSVITAENLDQFQKDVK